MEKVARQKNQLTATVAPRQLSERSDDSDLKQRLEKVKSQQEKNLIAEEYVFGKNDEILYAKSELQDQLRRADEVVNTLGKIQNYRLYDPLAKDQGGILLKGVDL